MTPFVGMVIAAVCLDLYVTVMLCRKYWREGFDKGFTEGYQEESKRVARLYREAMTGPNVPVGTKPRAVHGDNCSCETCRDERAGSGNS